MYIFICLCVLFIYWQCCDVGCSVYRPIALVVTTIGKYRKDVEENDLSPVLSTTQIVASRN